MNSLSNYIRSDIAEESESLTRILHDIARDKRIAAVSGLTYAQGRVIHYLTDRVVAAETWTGILTLGPDARSIGGTVGIHRALGTATLVRIARIIR